MGRDLSENIHASCVALAGRAVLILGPSGSGKSGLALQMMAYGAGLVADDRVDLSAQDGALIATAPPTITGLIEARGIGVLNADVTPQSQVVCAVDMGRAGPARIPTPEIFTVLGCDCPLFSGKDVPHLAASLMQFLKAGQSTR